MDIVTLQFFFLNKDLLLLLYFIGSGIRSYYHISAFMTSEKRHTNISWFIKNVLDTYFFGVIKRLKKRSNSQLKI